VFPKSYHKWLHEKAYRGCAKNYLTRAALPRIIIFTWFRFIPFSVADLLALFKRNTAKRACLRISRLLIHLTQSIIRDLRDLLHQAIQFLMRVYFALAFKRESVHPLVVFQVSKYMLHSPIRLL
jgi:hypothetical protein